MESEYRIAVIQKSTGTVVASWEPGLKVEKDFEEEFAKRLEAKGVGVGKTAKHVIADAKAALKELLFDLKSMV